jgi:hypothetical protein
MKGRRRGEVERWRGERPEDPAAGVERQVRKESLLSFQNSRVPKVLYSALHESLLCAISNTNCAGH